MELIVNLALGGCRNYMPLTFGGLKLYDIILGVVGACTRVRPRHKRRYHVRLSIENITFCSAPKDSRKGCPYGSKSEFHSKPYLDIVGEPLAGSLAPTFIPVRLSIGIQTFNSTPKDSRKPCHYELI